MAITYRDALAKLEEVTQKRDRLAESMKKAQKEVRAARAALKRVDKRRPRSTEELHAAFDEFFGIE